MPASSKPPRKGLVSLFDQPFTFDRIVRLALTASILYGSFLLISYLQDVLIPFAVAALIAYILNPLVAFFQHKLRFKSRIVSILVVLVLVLAALVGVTVFTVPLIGRELIHMEELVKGLAKANNLEQRLQEFIPSLFGESLEDLLREDEVQAFFKQEKTVEYLLEAGKKLVPGLMNLFSGALSVVLGVVGLLIVLLYLVFILIDYDEIMVKWKDLLHSDIRGQVVQFVEDFESAMSRYFRAQTLIALLVGVLFAIGFSIIGLPLAIVFGLFVGLLNLVPYLQTVAIIPAAFLAGIYCLENEENFWWMMGLVLVVFAVVQLAQDAYLTPKIMGDATGLNPAVILLALSVWGKLLGILGLIIALPVTFLIVSYYKSFLTASGSEPDPNDP